MGLFCFQEYEVGLTLGNPLIAYVTAVTNHHKLGSLNTEIYCLTDLEARCPRAMCHQGWVLLRVVRENLPCAFLLSLGGLLAIFDIPWLITTP